MHNRAKFERDTSFKFFKHFQALMKKRIRQSKRDLFGLNCEVIFPVLLILIGCMFWSMTQSYVQDLPVQKLNPDALVDGKTGDQATGITSPQLIQQPKGDWYNRYGEQADMDAIGAAYSNFSGGKVNGTAVPIVGMGEVSTNFLPINQMGLTYNTTFGAAMPFNGEQMLQRYQFLNMTDKTKALDNQAFAHEGESVITTQTMPLTTSQPQDREFVLFTNSKFNHGLPFGANWLANAVAETQVPGMRIEHSVHPMPYTAKEQAEIQGRSNSLLVFMVIIGLSLIPTSFVTFIVKEKETGCKSQQLIAGVSPLAQWTSTLTWDLIKHSLTAGLICAVIFLQEVTEISKNDQQQFSMIVSMFMLQGFAAAGMSQVLSFGFRQANIAMAVNILIHSIGGIVMWIAGSILAQLKSTTLVNWVGEDKVPIQDILDPIFMCFPGQNVASAMDNCFNRELLIMSRSNVLDKDSTCFHQEIAGKKIYALAISGAVYFILALLFEYLSQLSISTNDPKRDFGKALDDDVEREEMEVEAMDIQKESDNQCLIAKNMSKDQKKLFGQSKLVRAVHRVSLKVSNKECMVLLGTNGAGKSTMFRMLLSDTTPTNGVAQVNGLEVYRNKARVRTNMGYCPQEMALVELLTAREHIELFCEIRCIKREHINAMVEELITCMDLAMNKSNLVGRYSGGNKRKLMVAVAMCGEPQVIFLDEPSAGMDPAARRSMWEIIRAIKQRGCSVVLTTHSMEEAEALANRLAIMHEGRIRCIGNPQQLKDKFSQGFEAQIKYLKPTDEEIEALAKKQNLGPKSPINITLLNQILHNETGGTKNMQFQQARGIGSHVFSSLKREESDSAQNKGRNSLNRSDSQLGKVDTVHGNICEAALLFEFLVADYFNSSFILYLESLFGPNVFVLENSGLFQKIGIRVVRGDNLTEKISIGKLFGICEKQKSPFRIEYYSINQTTMEQIFQNFAKETKDMHKIIIERRVSIQGTFPAKTINRLVPTNNYMQQDGSSSELEKRQIAVSPHNDQELQIEVPKMDIETFTEFDDDEFANMENDIIKEVINQQEKSI